MLRYINVKVARDPQVAVINKNVPAWELPVLEEVFGEGNIVKLGDVSIERDPPDAEAEYKRLGDVYGGTGNPKVSFVERVYGAGSRGQAEVGKAIAESVQPDDELTDALLA